MVRGNRFVVHKMAEILTCTIDNKARTTVTYVSLEKATGYLGQMRPDHLTFLLPAFENFLVSRILGTVHNYYREISGVF